MTGDHVSHHTHHRGTVACGLRSRAWDVVKIVLIVLVLKWLILDLVRIPSASMEPLLHGDPSRFRGDYVAVNKFAFGLRIPFTTQRIVPWGEVRRWDVVVFRNPDVDAENAVLIKRVVGLPGEEVLIRDGAVLANGAPLAPPADLADIVYYMRFPAPSPEAVRDMMLALAQRQTIPFIFDPQHADFRILVDDIKALSAKLGERDPATLTHEERDVLIADVGPTSLNFIAEWLAVRYRVKSEFQYGVHAQPELMLVPQDHYYLLGDNSRDSIDSRAFGWVHRDAFYGRAFAIVLPPSRIRDVSGFTQTWWGPLLLIGLPLLVVLAEVLRAFVIGTMRVSDTGDGGDFRRGDRILLLRAAYSLRAPFARTRRWQLRSPQNGDLVAYIREGRTAFGTVIPTESDENSMQQPRFVTIRRDSSFDRVPPGTIEGRVLARVWPWERRRRFRRQGGHSGLPE